MQRTTLGLFAILVLFAGVLTHATSDVFAVVDKKPISSTEKMAQEEQAKKDEKTNKDSTGKSADNKSVGKTSKSTGLHNKKMNTAKAKRGLVAQKTKQ